VAPLQERLQAALKDRYTIELELGRGGWSVVYLAWDKKTDRAVAIKALRPEQFPALGHDRFLNEIRLIAQFNHPYILALHDWGAVDHDLLYYIMPVEGESLRDRLARGGRLPVSEALTIAREVCEALEYAHRLGVIHRDIKPDNILLKEGHAVVSDFGIARAISIADEQRLSGTDVVLGTPEYMSPEQARRGPLDGRTDIYSLGVTLYEVLTGELPRLDLGAALKTLERLRPDVSPALARAVRRALAAEPADRFATAMEFGAALGNPRRSSVWARRLGGRWSRIGAAAMVTAVAVAAGVKVAYSMIASSRLDSTLYVVVPFGHRGDAAPSLLNGDQCEVLLSQAFGRWTDLRMVDRIQVNDALLRLDDTVVTLRSARAVARNLQAGMLVWGDLVDVGDSVLVTAALYDVRRTRAIRSHSVRVHPESDDIAGKFQQLADTLLLGSVASPVTGAAALGTQRLMAFHSYADGHAALSRWDLAAARTAFRAALAADPNYPQANFWLAQVMSWAGDSTASWRPHASRAHAGRERLGFRERGLADGLSELADGRFAQACDRYESLVARDSTSFAAWFGLGECHRLDQAVVRDSASPSGWRFRTSYRTAIRAYVQAMEIVPTAYLAFRGSAFERLSRLLYVENGYFRGGVAVQGDTIWFAAFPSLVHDTIAFVPYPRDQVFSGRPEANPPSTSAAIERNRRFLRDLAVRWVRAFPDSADAHGVLAGVLETTGEIADGPPDHSALVTVRRARRLVSDRDDRLRLAVAECRLLVKLGRFVAARELADSILRAWPNPEPASARRLAGLAALTGRAHRTAHLLADAAPDFTFTSWTGIHVPRPLSLARTALALRAYAAMGAPADSLRVLRNRLDSLARIWVEPARQQVMTDALLDYPQQWAFPQLGARPVHRGRPGFRHSELLWAVQQGDTASIQGIFAELRALRANRGPGAVAVSGTYLEARALLAIGDTALAIGFLDGSLDALPTLGTTLLDNVDQAAGLVRAMGLRAELADRAADAATARRWASGVVELWVDADTPELARMVERMRMLAGGRGR